MALLAQGLTRREKVITHLYFSYTERENAPPFQDQRDRYGMPTMSNKSPCRVSILRHHRTSCSLPSSIFWMTIEKGRMNGNVGRLRVILFNNYCISLAYPKGKKSNSSHLPRDNKTTCITNPKIPKGCVDAFSRRPWMPEEYFPWFPINSLGSNSVKVLSKCQANRPFRTRHVTHT